VSKRFQLITSVMLVLSVLYMVASFFVRLTFTSISHMVLTSSDGFLLCSRYIKLLDYSTRARRYRIRAWFWSRHRRASYRGYSPWFDHSPSSVTGHQRTANQPEAKGPCYWNIFTWRFVSYLLLGQTTSSWYITVASYPLWPDCIIQYLSSPTIARLAPS